MALLYTHASHLLHGDHGHAHDHGEGIATFSENIIPFLIGNVLYLLFDRFFARDHSHSSLLRASSIIPHSIFDGVIWGMSLGLDPEFSSAVFAFLLLHRSVEVSSWMGLFSNLSRRKAMGLLGAMLLSFAGAALLISQLLSSEVLSEYKHWIHMAYLVSLGYLVPPMLKELFDRVMGLSFSMRIIWLLTVTCGFVLASMFEHYSH